MLVRCSSTAAAGYGEGGTDGNGGAFTRIDTWGSEPQLRRMPYALATMPSRPGWLLAGLRGGALLVSGDAGDGWTRLSAEVPDIADLALATR